MMKQMLALVVLGVCAAGANGQGLGMLGVQTQAQATPAATPGAATAATGGTQRPWVLGYYASWNQKKGALAPEGIDFTALTHLVHFAVLPGANGSVDDSANGGLSAEMSRAVVTAAHARGRKALISVGGAHSAAAFRAALADGVYQRFAMNLVRFTTARGYDGVDLDMEPLAASDGPRLIRFVRALRGALAGASPALTLTAATQWQPAIWGQVHDDLDRVNLMSYDLAGPWPGWRSWHNAPVYARSYKMPSGKPFPSINQMVNEWAAAGVPRAKLGIGVDFYGYVWTGVSGPDQALAGSKVSYISYADIMTRHYRPERYRYHAGVEAAYLKIDQPGTANDRFISFDDRTACRAKVGYVKDQGLGGMIIWELTGGHRRELPAGQRDPLLGALAGALASGGAAE